MSLDGSIEKVEGMLPALNAAKNLGYSKVFLLYDPLLPIDMFEDLECIAVQHINEVIQYLHEQTTLALQEDRLMAKEIASPAEYQKDFSHIIGHGHAKYSLEIAVAGGHNVLMSGPPGCGKSLLAEVFPSILQQLSKQQQLEVISLYQLAKEQLPEDRIRPFWHPPHSSSSVAIIGDGSYPKPGEISLAHQGVLFLRSNGTGPSPENASIQ